MSDSNAVQGGRTSGSSGDPEKRTGPVTFYRQVVAELRKVIWPTRRELVTYTAVVLVFVAFMVAIVALFDFGAAQGVLAVFGDG